MRLLFLLLALALVAPAEAQHALGIDTTAIDPDVRPQDDFYRWVNGRWLERTEIPSDRSRYGSFDVLALEAREHVRQIIEDAVAGRLDDPDAQRIAAAYTSAFDSARVETLGIAPLAEDLARIDAVRSAGDLPAYFAASHRNLGATPFGVGVGQDQRAADRYAVSASQGGLGLPDRSYYLEERFAPILEAYEGYLTELFTLADVADPAGSARRAIAVETRLAEAQWTRVQSRDREATYNKMAVADLDAAHANLRWRSVIGELGLATDSVIVRQPSYFDALDGLLGEIPASDWQAWLRARLLDGAAPMLPQAFQDAHFAFRSRTLAGQPEPELRWRQAVAFTEGVLGEAVGRAYVARYYPEEAASRMANLIENLRIAFRESIEELDWMAPETRAEALEKLARFNVKIGHPEVWRDYSTLELRGDDLIGNARRASAFSYDWMAGRLGGPVDRTLWGMTPQTVNAYYSPTMNEIVFPAAILQPPFFDVTADDAVNYGGIGAVIGHEFSHGFDDQGRRSDGYGNLRDWWTEADAAEYTRRAQAIVDQYSAYEPLPGSFIDGALGLGENIADLAGLTMAYRAYRNSLGGEEAPVIDGFTGDQRFFMGWAQVWRILFRDEELRQRLVTGPHAPGEYRTNGIVPHLDAFHEAFEVEPGDGMWRAPEVRIRIW
jgi:putative endopeptidase